ncbi:energy-coupling factor ABC transporter ATP-binding protein [Thermosulfurimonas dismutans]|uniref:ABC-type tungstate transport system, ATP-binding protein n=1 Tax=Thermosulfurimonas dismutans TaxID=999894 RepID=A0A179D1Z8_9BACT|nr:ABC-type tungstate transport system, ATP-binding protein [Thermosulfurimonas dismutans]
MIPLYEIKNLIHKYGEKVALKIDNLTISDRGVTALLGPNGAGKSTLLRLLALVEKPTQGQIYLRGEPVGPFCKAFRKVTLLPQQPYLLKRSVFENIAYGLKIRGKKKNLRQKVCEVLSWVGLDPDQFLHRPWYALSGGEAQRVALASRLVLQPEVLLLDEPTASVDAKSAQLIKEAVTKAVSLWGTSLIIATHDWAWINEIADRTLYLIKGHVLPSEMSNLIFGPWTVNGRFWEKRFRDGQRLLLEPPPSKDMDIALISSSSVEIFGNPKPVHDQNLLSFWVTRLNLKTKSGQILVTFSLEDVSFTLEFSKEKFSSYGFVPGKKVWLSFPKKASAWL